MDIYLPLGSQVQAATKTWKRNVDAERPENWIGGTYSKNCIGIIFPERFEGGCMMGLKNITTSEIVLPFNGDIVIDGDIELEESNKDCE